MTLIDKAEALLPCPFCGGEARYQADHTTECRDSVWCGACDFGMFDPDEQGSVVAAWNRRAIPATDARAEALAAMTKERDEASELALTLQSECEELHGELAAERAKVASPERLLADKILAELVRARTKFPGKNVTFAALVEEVGELATATFEESAERVEKEAVQVAVMAMRMVLDGDHCFDDWRREKGLDALDPSARAALSEAEALT